MVFSSMFLIQRGRLTLVLLINLVLAVIGLTLLWMALKPPPPRREALTLLALLALIIPLMVAPLIVAFYTLISKLNRVVNIQYLSMEET